MTVIYRVTAIYWFNCRYTRFNKGCFGHWISALWKLLFGGHSSKSLQLVACPIAKATFIDLGYITNACSPSALEIKATCFGKQVTKVKVKSAHHHFSQPCHDAFDGRLPSNRAITGGNVSMLIMFRLA